MKVIGVAGCKGAGKGATALQVQALHPGQNVKIIGFSDKLKVLAARAIGFSGTDEELIALMDRMKRQSSIIVNYDECFCHPLTGRQYLQWFGDNTRKLLGEDVWVNAVLPTVTGPYTYQTALRMMHPGVDVLVLADMRYPNEAERVRAVEGVNWEVCRPGCNPDGHVSEIPLDRSLVDWQLDNSKDLDNLRHEVEIAIEGTLL